MYNSKLLKPTDFDTQGVITSGTRSGHLHQFSILFFAVPDVPGDLLGILRPLGAKLGHMSVVVLLTSSLRLMGGTKIIGTPTI